MANSDPFSSSVIPFEVPEQMRAFAEKGVSQARDNYAKFKEPPRATTAPSRRCSPPPARAPAILRQADGHDEGRRPPPTWTSRRRWSA